MIKGYTVGKRIKKLRKLRHMTRSELAEKIDVTKATVSAYENETKQPSYDVLVKIAQTFHVSTDNLLCFGSRYVVDVSALTPEQRLTISDIALVYRVYNMGLLTVKPDSKEYENLKKMGLTEKNYADTVSYIMEGNDAE